MKVRIKKTASHHFWVYLRFESFRKCHPDLFVTICPRCEVKDRIWRVFRNLPQELLQPIGLWGKRARLRVAGVKVDAIKCLQSRCVFDQQGVSRQRIDKPWLGSDVASVQGGRSIEFKYCIHVRLGILWVWENLQNITAPVQ